MNLSLVPSLAAHASSVFASGVDCLGIVCWQSIRDIRVAPSDLDRLARAVGLPCDSLPKPGHPADCFRRATSPVQKRDGVALRYLVRGLLDNPAEIARAVIVETVDAAGRTLAHKQVAVMSYERATQRFSVTREPCFFGLSPASQTFVDGMLDEARANYDAFRISFTGPQLSAWVKSRLDALSCVSVHPRGGVYFVPTSRADDVSALGAFVESLSAYCVEAGASHLFAALPVPRTPAQVETVSAGFRHTVSVELDALVADMAETLAREASVRASTVESKMEQFRALRRKAEEYSALLSVSVADVASKLDVLEMQADEMLTRISLR